MALQQKGLMSLKDIVKLARELTYKD